MEDQKTEERDLRKRGSQRAGIPNARDQRVSVLQTGDYIAVSPHTPLSQAIEAMKTDEGGCVIISDDGRVAGIFTERDLLTKVLGENANLESPISEWMQSKV
ncbi:MAG TPA: CBS domain-containing protein, partial [Pyrinomonadaceae bacterium]|nr:CBS domain-containing protein [Pyrinomonadaceae bacterium]